MITVVMDGQYGSCGKGEFIAYLAKTRPLYAVVRTGGPNAGHTVTRFNKADWPMSDDLVDWRDNDYGPSFPHYKMRHVPAAWVNNATELFLSPGALINPRVLHEEVSHLRDIGWDGVLNVDRHATIITEHHEEEERRRGMRQAIGSTTEGIGAARADKIWRWARVAGDLESGDWPGGVEVVDVPYKLNEIADWGLYDDGSAAEIVIESTQGFGLSLELSGEYPFTTSANIHPAALMGECGLSPNLRNETIVLMRTYPIRVAGNSGPMYGELTWEEVHEHSQGRAPKEGERTTVTNLVRRISGWDPVVATRMARLVRPTYICLTFLDYRFPKVADVTDPEQIINTNGVAPYLSMVYRDCKAPVRWVSTGPGKICELPEVFWRKLQ